MNILGIDQITYSASDLAASRRCFSEWGLSLVEETAGRLVFESVNGCRVLIADPALTALPPAIEEGPTLCEVVWGVRDTAALAALKPPAQQCHARPRPPRTAWGRLRWPAAAPSVRGRR